MKDDSLFQSCAKASKPVEFTDNDLMHIFKAHVQAACFYIDRVDFKSFINGGLITVVVSHGHCGDFRMLFPGSMIASTPNGTLEIYIAIQTIKLIIQNHENKTASELIEILKAWNANQPVIRKKLMNDLLNKS